MAVSIGLSGKSSELVTNDKTALEVGSGGLLVYATPCMIALMEKTAMESIRPYLEQGQGSVGIKINVSHVSASPIGCEIYCESEVIEIDRRRIVFSVKAFDEHGLIGEGVHERFIIDNNKFFEKALEKVEK